MVVKLKVHADGGDCHGSVLDAQGTCPKCGITPDMQSIEMWEVASTQPDGDRGTTNGKVCSRCGESYNTEKVMCPTCMADPTRLLRSGHRRSAQPDTNPAADNIGKLNAHGLAELHAAVVAVVDRDMYDLSDNGDGVVDAERLARDICDEVVRRAAPATAGGRGK